MVTSTNNPKTQIVAIVPLSANEIATDGKNSIGGDALIEPRTQVPYTNSNATAFASASDLEGSALFTNEAMTYLAAYTDPQNVAHSARWSYTAGAMLWQPGAGPWTIIVDIYGPAGLNDTHLRHIVVRGNETNEA